MARIHRDSVDSFLEYGIDVSTRTLYIGYGDPDSDTEVDHILTSQALKGLYLLNKTRVEEDINVIINCQGGDTQHGLAIYDAIHNSPSNCIGTVYGYCYSIAAWILQGCTWRRMSKHSSMMIHNGDGTKDKFNLEQDALCNTILLNRIREKHPKFPASKLEKMLLTDTYLWPHQALELGLIDEVIE